MKLTAILGVTMLTALGATSAQADHRQRELGYVIGGAIIGAARGELIYDSRRHRHGHGYYRYDSHYGYDRYPRYRSSYYRYRPHGYYRSYRGRHHNHGPRRSHRRHRSYRY